MSVYKEAVYAVNQIQKSSKQIYGDACDFGVPVLKNDKTWELMKQLVGWYGVQGTREEHRYSTGATISQVVEYMPNEHESSRYERVKVIYVVTPKSELMDGYVYLEKI